MRIALLGATGRTGGEYLEQALAAGPEVVGYVRRPEALEAKLADHGTGESQLAGTGRPRPRTANRPQTANPVFVDYAPGRKMPRAARTNRADVAAAMLDSIGDPGKLGKQMLRASAAQTG